MSCEGLALGEVRIDIYSLYLSIPRRAQLQLLSDSAHVLKASAIGVEVVGVVDIVSG